MVQPVEHPQEPDKPQDGPAADPRVVAERRARRAELNEVALRERVVDAEARLVEAQRLLGSAHDQRKELAARLKQAERDLRTARQGEHAEARRRVELEEDAGAARRRAEREIAALRAALVGSEQRVRELEDELDRVQRDAAELQQAVAAAQARRPAGPADGEAVVRARDAVAAELAARLDEVRAVEERLAAGRDDVASRQAGLGSRLQDSTAVAGGLEEQLVAEREHRVRAVRALEDERERAAAEVTLLQHELDRRLQVHETVARQLVDLRAELAHTQQRVRTAAQLRDELQTLEDERHELERQLAAARLQVAERDAQLDGERRDRDRVEAELQARLVEERLAFRSTVEAHRQALEAAIASERAAFEAHVATVRDGFVELRARLGDVDAEAAAGRLGAEREARLAAEQRAEAERAGRADALAQLETERATALVAVAEQQALRTRLAVAEGERDRLLAELATARDALAARTQTAEGHAQLTAAQDRFHAQMADMEQRVAEMREEVQAAGAELARQLSAEREARWSAEEQLRRLRELTASAAAEAIDPAEVAGLRAMVSLEQAGAARAEERIVELEDELERTRVALRPPPAMPPADHPALRETPAPPAEPSGSGDKDSVIIDLARAAARLRIRREEALDEPASVAPVDEPGQVVPDADAEPIPAVEADPAAPAEVEIGRRADVADPRHARAWLTPVLVRLAARDPQAVASTLEALVPVQAARLGQDVTYDLLVEGQPPLRVCLHRDGTSSVGPGADDPRDATADFRVAGTAAALAPLFGGGAGRRIPVGVTLTGSRRRGRKLVRAFRRPVTLGALAAAGTGLSTVDLLTLVLGSVEPGVSAGERFTVAFAGPEGDAEAHVVVADTLPLDVRAGAPAHAAATVRTAPGTLAGFLAGDATARVTGDVSAVGRLLAWADAAQGLDA